MARLEEAQQRVRFGPFEYNATTGDLRRGGHKVKLAGQPLELLNLMIEYPGELVTREEMQSRLWPQDTFVDFEHSLNSAIKKLRQALGDSAAKPRFIETIARRGYRFIAAVEPIEIDGTTPVSPQDTQAPVRPLLAKPRILLAVIVLLLSAALYIATRRPYDHAPSDRSKLTLLIAGEGDLSDPAISSDGKMLAYVKAEGGTRRIYVRRLAGGSPIRLWYEEAREVEPAFSPDDERIAFTRYQAHSIRPQICVAPVLGGKPVGVVDGARNPAWSPDGTRLAFVLEELDGVQALATATSDGAGVRIILGADDVYPFLHYPSWSADGRSIAFERSIGGIHGEIWVVPADGGAALRLETPPPGVYLHHPVFTLDGKGLVYSSNRAGGRNLWFRPISKDGADTQLTRGPGPEEWPSLSRTGHLVFLKVESKDVLLTTRLGSNATSRLLSHSPFLWAPSISPDGTEVAFSQGEYNGSWRIWATSLTGMALRPLTSGQQPQIYSRFSRDGHWLIYFTWTPGASRIWRVSARGGPAQPLTLANEDAAYGDLSPDGRMLAFARTGQGSTYISLIRVDGGAERQLIHSSSTVPRWSPDGNWIAFSPNRSLEGGVFITHPDGSGTERLTNSGGWPVWFPDGKRLAFRTLRPDGTQRIEAVTLKNGHVAPLASIQFSGDNYPFDFSPDGRFITYTNGETSSSEIWLLVTSR